MNKNKLTKNAGKKIFDKRIKDFLLLAAFAILLLFVAGKVFQSDKSQTTYSENLSETEERVLRLLREIDGVGEADVIVYETKEGVQSVVVVCEGANDLKVIMDVREAVAAALGTEEKSIKIYLKKE